MTDIYRDPTDGATARRVDLLRRRRDELVTMPHAVRRVVVARGARIAASCAMALVGAVLVGSSVSPRLGRLVGHLLPPDDPAVIATGLLAAWLGGALVYAIARSIAEHRFAVAMTRCVLPGEDLHQDLERLSHETPDEVARRMAHRLEVRSAAMPVMAAALVGPATLAYLALAASTHGWPANRAIEHTLCDHANLLLAGAFAGLVATLLVVPARLRSPSAAVPAGVVAVTALVLAIALRGSSAAWLALPVVATTGMIAMTARKLRIERGWIETEDPAAGTELVAQLARWLAEARRFTAAHAGMITFVCAALGFGLVGRAAMPEPQARVPSQILATAFLRATTPVVIAAPQVDAPPVEEPSQAVKVTREEFGKLVYDIDFEGAEALVATGLVIPSGWEARIEAHVETTTMTDYSIAGIGTLAPHQPFDVTQPVVCTTQAPLPVHLHIRTTQPGHHTLRLVVQPSLRASHC